MAGGSVRDAIKLISPKWLQTGVGEKFLYVFGLACDVLLEKLNQAMRMHIPTYGDSSGLATIGTDRLIPQGPNEPVASYALRLKKAYDTWQHAGSAGSILQQILGYLNPVAPRVFVVGNGLSNTNPWDSYAAGANPNNPPQHYLANPANWDWDGFSSGAPDPTRWWRIWIGIDCSSGSPFTNEGTWGDGKTWGDGGTWGSSASSSDVASIQQLVQLWKPANVQCVNVILFFDGTLFDQALAFGSSKLPDSNFGLWEKITSSMVSVPSRFSTAAYWDGVF